MRPVLAVIFVGAIVGALSACGDDGDDTPFADSGPVIDAIDVDARVAIDGGDVADSDVADGDVPPPDGPVDDEGPLVEVLSPTAPTAGDFSSTAIVTDDRFTARCSAATNPATGDAVDPSSVSFTVIAGTQSREAFAQPTTVDNEYVADLVVSDFANGALTIRCTASDTSASSRTNSDDIATFLDLGPKILVFTPVDDASYANQVNVGFKVLAAPVAPADTGAAPNLAAVTLNVGGVDISADLSQDPPDSGVFTATVVFADPRFVPALDGDNTVIITAANSRTATPTTRQRNIVFVADSDGPSIEVTGPVAGDFIAGIFTLTASVTDQAGVDALSVIATIAGTHEFALHHLGADAFAGSFDTRALPDTMVYPTIVVRARDSVGNQSSVGLVVTLDNQPPLASLDPPDMREASLNTEIDELECSWMFDPLGGYDPGGELADVGDAADDGQSVAQLSEIRARVEDRGNQATADSGVLIPMSGVDFTSVQLFVLDDSDAALIVDTTGDGYCDAINPQLVPTSVPNASNEAAVIDMIELAPSGDADFTFNPEPPTVAQPAFDTSAGAPEADCFPGTKVEQPEPLCITSPGTRITYTAIEKDPVIFTIPPVTDIQCFGNPFDSLATNISDGWACLALVALDNLGNVAISAPLRLCFDHDGDEVECEAWGTITSAGLPDCVGTYDPDTDVTNAALNCVLREVDLPVVPPNPKSWLFEDYPGRQLRRIDL